MKVQGMFHVYNSNKKGEFQFVDGMIIRDLKKNDNLIIIKNIDIKYHIENCDNSGCINVENNRKYENVIILNIFSYGVFWDDLSGGMSARLKCCTNTNIINDCVLYKIIE